MEETVSCIARGCKLARDIESNLPNLAKQPRMLSNSCAQIIRIFRTAKERLDAEGDYSSQYAQMFPHGIETGAGAGEAQEWLRTTYHLQALQAQYGGIEPATLSSNPPDREGSARPAGSGGEFQAVDRLDSGNTNSQRSRRRKDDIKKRTVTEAAPRIGNTDIPPDDNFTWRKYGQKEILGSKYPRSYYRCTHQKLYNCPAKKQVQRLDHDPFMFDITYIDEHTCHKSATAPSVSPPPPPPEMTLSDQVIQTTAAHLPMGRWLSMDLGLGEGGRGGGGASSSSIIATGTGTAGAGSSTIRFGREMEYPVVDLADTMFNSGSSSSNSMDFLFTHNEDKWEQPASDKKN